MPPEISPEPARLRRQHEQRCEQQPHSEIVEAFILIWIAVWSITRPTQGNNALSCGGTKGESRFIRKESIPVEKAARSALN